MQNFESIMKWYNQSQIEYITPFLKLWFAFEGYLNQIFPTENNQRELIEKTKTKVIYLSGLKNILMKVQKQATFLEMQ